ncbi:YcxB family protein [Streptomyces sp. NPDC055749]
MDSMGGDSSRRDTDRGTTVEFVYRPTAADFEEALRARARRTPAGRVEALLVPLVAAVAAVVVGVLREAPLIAWIITLVFSVGIGAWGIVWMLRFMARRMFSIVEPYGQCRTVADENGAVSTGERASSSADWSVFREYLETPGLFVLVGGDRAAGIAVMPKRGAQDPADVDRLRAILDRNLKRL